MTGKHRSHASRTTASDGYARYIGRVGALAVALGIGTAVGTAPGLAWASPETGSVSGDAGTSDTAGSPPRSSPASTEAGDVTAPAHPRPDTSVEPEDDEPEDADTEAGDDLPTDSPNTDSGEVEPSAAPTAPEDSAASGPSPEITDTPTPDPAPPAKDRKSSRKTPAPAADAASPSAASPSAAPTVVAPVVPSADRREAGVNTFDANSAAPPAVRHTVVEPTAVVATAAPKVPDVPETPAEQEAAHVDVATRLVSFLSPLVVPSPNTPAAPALMWAVMAFTRRESQNLDSEPAARTAALTPAAAPTGGLGDAFRNLLTAASNQPPTASPTIDAVDSTTGVVTGKLNATDRNGDPLTYTIKTPPGNGTATLTSTGAFTYTPSARAQHEASATRGTDVDKFVVTIRDGRGGVTNVTVKDLPITPKNSAPINGTSSAPQTNPVTGVVTGAVSATDPDNDKLTYRGNTTTTKGGVVVNANGSYTYTPTAAARHAAAVGGAAATDSFTVTADDGHGGTLAVAVNVTIAPANKAPTNGKATVGQPDRVSGVVTGTVKATDADRDTLTYSGTTTTAKGSVVVNTNGGFTYTPTAAARQNAYTGGAAAKDSFTVTVDDGHGGTTVVPVSVTISPNRAPVTGNSSVTQPNPVTGVVTGSVTATDPDGDPVTYSGSGEKPKGSVVVQSNGTFTYTPTDQARVDARLSEGPDGDTFSITAADGRGGTLGISVNVVVAPENRAPVPVTSPTVGTPDGNGVVTGSLSVADPDGGPLTYDVISGPAKGSVEIDRAAGTYTYTPTDQARLEAALSTNTVEKDTFTVRVSDGVNAPVTVTVSDVLVAELPANSVIATPDVGDGPTAVVVSRDGSRAYVANTDGNTITVLRTSDDTTVTTIEVGPRPVAIALNSTGSVLYVATAGDNSVVAINTVTFAPGGPIVVGGEPTGIAVSTNDALVFTTNANDTVTIIEVATGATTSIDVDPTGLDVSPDGRYLYLANPADAAMSIIDLQTLVRQDVPVGSTPFGVVVSPTGDRVYVTITDEDRVAVIDRTNNNAVTYVTVGDEPRGIDITDDGRVYVANYASDSVAVIDVTSGNVTFVGVGNGPWDVEIDPVNNEATITNRLEDTVTVLLLTGNEPPVVAPTVDAPNPSTGAVSGSLNASDADGDTLAYSVASHGTSGTVVINPSTGDFVYTPTSAAREAAGATPGIDNDTFTLTVDDGHGASVTTTLTVVISPANSAPVAADDSVTTTEDAPVIIDVLANDVDVDGDPLTATVISTPMHGSLVVNGDGTFTYTPAADYRGADGFTYVASDGTDTSNIATVSITVATATTSLPGNNGNTVYTADRTRAIVTTQDGSNTFISVVNTETSTQVGQSITVTGGRFDLELTNDGRRAVISAVTYGGSSATRVVVVDTATGAQVGTTVTLDAAPLSGSFTGGYGAVRLSGTGNRAVVTTNSLVAIIDTETGAQIGDTIVTAGNPVDPASLSSDGTRATITTVSAFNQSTFTYTMSVTVIDTATAAQIGDTITILSGSPSVLPLFSADGTRATLSAATYNRTTDTSSTQFKVIDVMTGTQIGNALDLAGDHKWRYAHLSADGTRATVTTYVYDRTAATFSHQVVVIDTGTVSQIGTTTVVTGTGQPVPAEFSADGTRAIIAPTTDNTTTRITVIDTTTGTQLGSTLVLTGYRQSIQFDVDSSLAYVTTNAFDSGHPVTRVAVIDTTTGSTSVLTYDLNPNEGLQLRLGPGNRALSLTGVYEEGALGETLVRVIDPATGVPIASAVAVPGFETADVRFNIDGTRAIITGYTREEVDRHTTIYTTYVAIIDAASGNQVGETITLPGQLNPDGIQFSGDDTRAVYTTYTSPSAVVAAEARVMFVAIDSGAQLGDTVTLAGYPAAAAHFSADGESATIVVSREGSPDTQVVLLEVPAENLVD